MPVVNEDFANRFNQQIADALVGASTAITGLPAYLGFNVTELTPGYLRAQMDVVTELLTPMGSLHGGVMAALVDHALGCVMYPLIPPGAWAATTEFKLNYMSAVKEGVLTACSTVLSMTRRTAVVRVDVDNDGKLACAAQGTLLIVEPKNCS